MAMKKIPCLNGKTCRASRLEATGFFKSGKRQFSPMELRGFIFDHICTLISYATHLLVVV
jgi:hypothetical protein